MTMLQMSKYEACMNSGYLYIEALMQQEHAYRLAMSLEQPIPGQEQSGHQLVYIARFTDIDAAFMHAGGKLRRRCKYLDTQTFITDLPTMIATIEADGLKHERVWLADVLDAAALETLAALSLRFQKLRENQELSWKMVGIVAVILLVVLSLVV